MAVVSDLIRDSSRQNHADTNRLFIVDGIISLPVCIAGFIFLPDVPEICNSFYLTKEVSSFG